MLLSFCSFLFLSSTSPSCHGWFKWLGLLSNSLKLHYWISHVCSNFAFYASIFHCMKICRWYRTPSFPFVVLSGDLLSRESGQYQHGEELGRIKLFILLFPALLCGVCVSPLRTGRCICIFLVLPPPQLWTFFNRPLCLESTLPM